MKPLFGPPPTDKKGGPGQQREQAAGHNGDGQGQVEGGGRGRHQVKAGQGGQRPRVVGQRLEAGGQAAGHLLDDARVLVRDHGVGVAVEDADGQELVAEQRVGQPELGRDVPATQKVLLQ